MKRIIWREETNGEVSQYTGYDEDGVIRGRVLSGMVGQVDGKGGKEVHVGQIMIDDEELFSPITSMLNEFDVMDNINGWWQV